MIYLKFYYNGFYNYSPAPKQIKILQIKDREKEKKKNKQIRFLNGVFLCQCC